MNWKCIRANGWAFGVKYMYNTDEYRSIGYLAQKANSDHKQNYLVNRASYFYEISQTNSRHIHWYWFRQLAYNRTHNNMVHWIDKIQLHNALCLHVFSLNFRQTVLFLVCVDCVLKYFVRSVNATIQRAIYEILHACVKYYCYCKIGRFPELLA